MTSSISYKPEIDGLRSIAVLAVIIFHAAKSVIPGGYLGVDIFFVISGFLITSIILREAADGNFSLLTFWKRRIKRILPAATFVLLITSLIQTALIYKPDLAQLTNQKFSALLSYANIYFWRTTGDYWGNAAEESPFIHYWSLSLEEQYYLFFPLFILLFIGKRKKYLPGVLTFFVLLSFTAFMYGAAYHPYGTFYLLPTRMWQLGAGCLLAIFSVSSNTISVRKESLSPIGTIIGIVLIGLAYFFPTTHAGIGYESLIVVIATCLIIWSGSNRISKIILENRLMLFIGQISFSLYLWHWPIIVTLRNLRSYQYITSNAAFYILGCMILLALSLISYYFVEKQVRKHRNGVVIALSFAAVVGLYFLLVEPHIFRKLYPSKYETPSWHGRYYDLRPSNDMSGAFELIALSVHTPPREANISSYKEGGIIRQRATKNVRVVLIGDSHAVMWSKLVDDVTGDLDLTTSLWSMNGESGLINIPAVEKGGGYLNSKERFEYDFQRKNFIEKWNPDVVIVSNCWEIFNVDSAKKFFNFLEVHAKNVLIVESPPVLQGVGNRSLYQYLSFLKMDTAVSANTRQLWPQVNVEDVTEMRTKLLEIVSEHRNFHFVPVADLFLSDSAAIVAFGKQAYYLDDDHLTDEGAKLLAPRFKSSIQQFVIDK